MTTAILTPTIADQFIVSLTTSLEMKATMCPSPCSPERLRQTALSNLADKSQRPMNQPHAVTIILAFPRFRSHDIISSSAEFSNHIPSALPQTLTRLSALES